MFITLQLTYLEGRLEAISYGVSIRTQMVVFMRNQAELIWLKGAW